MRTYLVIGNCVKQLVCVVLESAEARADGLGCRKLGVERGKVSLDSLMDELLRRN